jgi:serine/threonine-protein kinase
VFIRGGSLWAVPFDAATLQIQGTAVPVTEGIRVEGGGAVQYVVAGDGTLMYIPGLSSGASQLVWIDRAGREDSLKVPARPYYSVRLDSSGRRVALDVREEADGADIWVLPLGRHTPTRVTFDAGDDVYPTWTPDDRLVYSATRGENASLVSHAADGTGAAQQITSATGTLDQAAVTPDGKYVVARTTRTGDDIVLVELNGKGAVRKLLDGPFRERNPEVSRDGRWIAYQSDESGTWEVYVRPFTDVAKGKWQVSEQGGSRPVWAHNGKELLYLTPDWSVMSVTFTETAGAFVPSTPTRITALPAQFGVARAYDISPDDRRFLSIKPEDSTERVQINVVLNWFEELRKRVPVE